VSSHQNDMACDGSVCLSEAKHSQQITELAGLICHSWSYK